MKLTCVGGWGYGSLMEDEAPECPHCEDNIEVSYYGGEYLGMEYSAWRCAYCGWQSDPS